MPYNKGIVVHVKAAKGDPAVPEFPPAPAAIIDEEWDLPEQAKSVMVQLDPSEMFCISCEVKDIDPMPQRVIFKVHANNKERAIWQVGQREAYKSEWVYTLGGETPTSPRWPEETAGGGRVPRLVKKASRLFGKKQQHPEASQQKYTTLRVDAFRVVEKEEGLRLHDGELFDEPYASFFFYCYQRDEFEHLMPNATASSSIYEDTRAPGLGAEVIGPVISQMPESVPDSSQAEESAVTELEALPALKAKKSWAQGLRETFSRRGKNA